MTIKMPFPRVLLALLITAVAAGVLARPSSAAQWYKTEFHKHTVFSADGREDLGILANNMSSLGYNAVFVTDHDRGSSFQISGATANDLEVRDSIGPWSVRNSGLLGSSANAFVASPVHSGSASLHLAATSTGTGETMLWDNRGPNFRSGDITLDFWVNPVTIDPGSGVYVSAGIGGDSTITTPFGYTTSAGVVSPGKNTVLLWQIGTPRVDSSDPNRRVITHALPFTLSTWNHYVINVTTGAVSWNDSPVGGMGNGLGDIPAADQPDDQNALSYIKIAAQGKAGTADAYFDDYVLKATNPVCPSSEFVYRNSHIHDYDVPGSFQLFPSREMGQQKHAQQFNFGISDPTEYFDSQDPTICAATNISSAPWHFRTNGTDSIADVHGSGYPTQQNHPGITDTVAGVVSTKAHGADTVEAVGVADWTDPWDQILGTNYPIVGDTGSDDHETLRAGALADYVLAPSLGLDDIMHSYFEGRLYVAPNDSTGQVIFNIDPASSQPYPSRYPVYVPASQTSANVHLNITGGLAAGDTVTWVTNSGSGPVDSTVTPLGSTYEETRAIPLSGAFTYARAEIKTSAGKIKAITEPIFFEALTALPADKSFHVDQETTSSGHDYTIVQTKGITAASWSTALDALSFTLTNLPQTRSNLLINSSTPALDVTVDGTSIPAAATLGDYQAASGSSWFYDSGAGVLYLQDVQGSGSSNVSITFGAGGTDTQAPSKPAGLTATAVSTSEVDLSWTASTDDVGVTGYTIYRDNNPVGTVDGATTTFQDTGLTPSTLYTYTVDAFDAATNHSLPSDPASDTTFAPVGTSTTFNPAADAYVTSSSATSNFGTSPTVRVDSSPDTLSYLRFNLTGLTGAVSKAVLRMYATSNHSLGYDVFSVADNSWTEAGLNYNNKPALAASKTGSSGPITGAPAYTEVDVSPLVSGNGQVSVAVTPKSSTALAFSSREGANKPELVVTTAGGSDAQAPTKPAGLTATAVSTSEIDLSWSASSDNVGVTGYTIYRDNTQVGTVDGNTTTFQDTGLTPSTHYTYTVDAFDAGTNHSLPSDPAADTTFTPTGGTTTFNPAADSYVTSSSPTSNFGTATSFRVDSTPDTASYLRFNLTGLNGAVSKALLRVYATSNHTAGYDVFSVADNSWTETGLNYNNKPALAASKTGSSGKITGAPAYTEVDVTPLVSGNGPVSLALTTTSSTALAFSSREGANKPELVVTTAGGTDAQAPSKPAGLTATAVSTSEIDLTWSASTDNVGVTGYTIYRDGNPLTTVGASPTSFQDTGLAPSSQHTYTVDAFDAATNHSPQSDPASDTTFTPTGGTTTFNPVADDYVDASSPASNFGTGLGLRVDASPDILSYLRFNVAGLTGTVTNATLRVYATSSANMVGYDVFGVADNSWTETGLNYNNHPALAATKTGSSTKPVTNAYTTVDVTPLITGNGPVSLALKTTSSTALALSSKEAANKPELVVTTAGAGTDGQAPSKPAGLTATAVSTSEIDLTWSASTDNVGVTGYTIYRDNTPLTTVGSAPTSFQDTGLAPSSQHTYTVDAFDAAANHSSQSDPASDTTFTPTGGTTTFNPVADDYVDGSSPASNYGGLVQLRVDASPDVLSYLRFNVAGLTGTVTNATLRVYTTSSANTVGYDVFGVADNLWTETGLNYNNKPALAATKTGSSTKPVTNAYTTVDVTPLITGNGPVSLALKTTSSTALALSSKEAANKPELVVTTS